MLILSSDDVERALTMPDAIAAMRDAFVALAAGQVVQPERSRMEMGPGLAMVMPGLIERPGSESFTVKAVALCPGNLDNGLDRIQAAVLAFEPATGRPIALLEGGTLTAIRTAAAPALATDLLAVKEASTAAIIGAGAQASYQLRAMCCVRSIETAWIYGPTRSKVEALVATLRESKGRDGSSSLPDDIRIADSANEAVTNADIVCTVTSSRTPVFDNEVLKQTVHINAVGSYQPEVCEIPAATVLRASIVVDSLTAAQQEAGDLIQPINAGLMTWEGVVELGALLDGATDKLAELAATNVTLFKSVGLAVQDAAAARFAVERAQQLDLGTTIPW